jgi:hypothetical protein
LNKRFCGASRPLTAPEAGVLVVIIIIAGVLAVAGLPAVSVLVLIAEALSLGTRLLARLRHGGTEQAQAAKA